MLNDEPSRASLRGAQATQRRLPGSGLAALIAILSTLLAAYWARTAADVPKAAAATSASRLAEVGPDEIDAALDTVAEASEQLAQYRAREGCSRKLAWVTIAGSPGQPPGRIRLQSGNYISPMFDLNDTPVRVALPYPAPYAAGRGTIAVLGTTVDAIVALTPPWHVSAKPGLRVRNVTWAPVGNCPGANG